MTYDIDYFINKFEAIPEDKWTTGDFVDETDETKRCAYGHCGSRIDWESTTEADALERVFGPAGLGVTTINDGRDNRFPQPTPKRRVLAALKHIKGT